MNRRTLFTAIALIFVLSIGMLLAACGQTGTPVPSTNPTAVPGAGQGSTASDGQTLMQQRCSVCHSLDRIQAAQKTADQWQATVNRMIGHGAQLTPQEEQVLVQYLAQTYHP